ncbi:MAG: dockerin type I domain-containing protein, partial [Patescibacteria group bacterium]|nr:dockerin type I domain-containing protein [Patescibacteria group bacterium]
RSAVPLLALGTSTIILRSGTADRDTGSFQVNFVSGLPAGDRAFGVTAIDPQGRSTQAVVYWIKVKNQANVLDIKNILLPPTVGFSQSTVTKGGKLIITGYAVPNSVLQLEVDGKPISQQTIADSSGFYRLLYPTGSLGIDSHTLCVRESGTFGSAFSLQKVFYVTSLLVPQVDFNNDGVVDIRDWSIFLSRWLSPDPKVRALDDLNGDGKVDVQDFSIFVRTLKPA